MKIRKSIHVNILLVSPLLVGALIMAYQSIADFSKFGFIAAIIIILMWHYFKYQYLVYQHFVAIENGQLKVKSGFDRIEMDLDTIKTLEYANHRMKVVADGLEYEFNFAGYDVLKAEALIERMKTELPDHLRGQAAT